MLQCCSQAVGGCLFEVAQAPIHPSDIHPWISRRDPVRALPTFLVTDEPGMLVVRQRCK